MNISNLALLKPYLRNTSWKHATIIIEYQSFWHYVHLVRTKKWGSFNFLFYFVFGSLCLLLQCPCLSMLSSEIDPKDGPVSQGLFLSTMRYIVYKISENLSWSNFFQQFCPFVADQYPVNIQKYHSLPNAYFKVALHW